MVQVGLVASSSGIVEISMTPSTMSTQAKIRVSDVADSTKVR